MPDLPPPGFGEPEYGDTDVRPAVTEAAEKEASLPEAFVLLADTLAGEPLPFDWRASPACADYTGRAPFLGMLRAHIYRLAVPALGGHHAIASHLSGQPGIADRLGLADVPKRDTFRRFWNALDDDDREHVTAHAATLRREVAATGVPGAGALEPEWPDDEEIEEIPVAEKRRAVEHLRSFCYEQLGFQRAENRSYHRDELLDVQSEVSREQGFIQGTIEDRWNDGDRCHSPKTHFNAIGNRSTQEWRETFDSVFETQVQAAKNAGLFARPSPIHIDATIIPYYKRGPSDELPDGVTGNVKARGTHYGYKHVTVSAQDNGRSVCLASFDVTDRGQMEEAVKYLVRKAEERIDVSMLSMDSEFGKASLLGWLDDRGTDFVVHLPRKGKRLKRQLVQMDGHFDQAPYRFGVSSRDGPVTEGTVLVERDYDEDEPDGPEPGGGHESGNLSMFGGGVDHGAVDLDDISDQWWKRWRPYFTNMDVGEDEVEATIRRYKRRWAIETKYRVIKEEFLGRTTSRDYTARTFFWLFGVMLYNAWVLLDVFLRADYPDLAPDDRPAMAARSFAKQFFAVPDG